MMIRCGRRYGSPEGNAFLDELYRFIAVQAYLASADFAAEKGAFPQFDAVRFVESGFMRGMPEEVRLAVAAKGIRNVTLLTQAPTGTTGTMVATSTGIEPFFSWTYLRKSRLGLHEERVQVVEEWQAAHPGEPLPDTFVTAMDLTPEDHVGVQAAIQRWVDSSISKTCNVPSDYTVDQTRALYETMYRLGCKGGTVYRDSSRDEQVLMLKESAAVAKEPTPAAVERTIKPRPRQMLGTTYRVVSPVGKVYVTVNRNPEGEPFEVFVNVGKAGSDLAADAEAIGRLISLVQRLPSPLSPEERLLKVVEELDGIGGSRTVGFGAERVRSLPDGVAQALHEDQSGTQPVEPAEQLVLVPNADLCPMCGHASFVHTEGCQKCYSCGHSEC
jgi:ribonucleoside-diphosphate reductase alpha chain